MAAKKKRSRKPPASPRSRRLLLQRRTGEDIDREIERRLKVHRARVAKLRRAPAKAYALRAPRPVPLVLLAHGDSWFDYPLSGNGLSPVDTDAIAQLRRMGTVHPVIANLSHYGDATVDEMSLPKQRRMIEALQDPDNWLGGGKPDAILVSGGGNDIAGDRFCIFLDYAGPGATGLNRLRFVKSLGMMEASYRDLFAFRDRYAPGVPIFGHCYDFAIPDARHPPCAGPWLKPSLDYAGWDVAQGTLIVRQALQEFRSMLASLAAEPANRFTLVETQGLFTARDWANELHPYPAGFRKVAEKFLESLRLEFPNRI